MTAVARRRQPFPTPKLSSGPHFREFAARKCRHTKGEWAGRPLVFEPWQAAIWDAAFELDPSTNRRRVTMLLQGRPRKNYKSTECAALSLYLAGPDGEQEADVFLGAASREQAGAVFDQAIAMVRSPYSDLGAMFTPLQRAILYPRSNGSIKRISSEGFLAHGLNPHGVVLDELHAFHSEGQRELYRAMTTGHGLRRDPFLTTITTAGYDKNTILGELYDAAMKLDDVEQFGKHRCLTVARDPDAGFLMVWYGAPADADIENRELWRECNPAAALTMEFLEQQWASVALTTNDFCRLHLNMWTASKERWIGDAEWDDTRGELDIPAGARIYVAVDASISYDTTAVSWSWNHGTSLDPRTVERTRVWSTRRDVPHDVFVPTGRIDFDSIESFIVDTLARKYALQELVYDPRFFEDTATRLSNRGIRVAPLQQGSQLMYDAVQRFYADVKERRVTSATSEQGGDVLAAHVKAVAAVQTERGYKLAKLKSARPIDACVASVMAHARAAAGNATSAYEDRELLMLGGESDEPEDDEW